MCSGIMLFKLTWKPLTQELCGGKFWVGGICRDWGIHLTHVPCVNLVDQGMSDVNNGAKLCLVIAAGIGAAGSVTPL